MITTMFALAGAALCGAACVSNTAAAYLWAPGLILLLIAFRRTTHNPIDPRPGYIHDRTEQRHDHHQH